MAAALTSSATATTPRLLKHALQVVLGSRRGLATTTTTRTTAPEAAQQMLRAFDGQTRTLRQTLDGHQLQKLSLTLGRPQLHPGGPDVSSFSSSSSSSSSPAVPPEGTPLPRGYHLVYFAPAALEADLGADGTDRTFNAPPPFSRRMWAGGRMRWTPGVPLRVGDEVEERTTLVGAAPKRSRDGGEMVLVEVDKEYWGPEGLALVDRRSWVFRPPPPAGRGAPSAGDGVGGLGLGAAGRRSSAEDVKGADGAGVVERKLSWSPVALFRFSALTFNAHMIHYGESWTRNVEGHPEVVVHGPLNLICMMDYFRDVYGKEAREVSYRALSPLYAGDEYSVRTASTEDVEDGKSREIVVAKGSKICMKGTILTDD